MTDKTINNGGNIKEDCFRIYHDRKSNKKLQYYLELFNEEDYWIYKATRKQRLVGPEWKDFNNCRYTFFLKSKYNKDHINMWIEFIGQFGGLMFLDNIPPLAIMNKIKII